MTNLLLKNKIYAQLALTKRALARNNFVDFVKYTMPAYQLTPIHYEYLNILNYFAHGKIKKLLISMPPQHGKTEAATRKLIAYMLGLNPNLYCVIASYNATYVRKLSVQTQNNIISERYNELFKNTTLAKTKYSIKTDINYMRTKDEFQIVNYDGSVIAVGREGGLTGNPVDCIVMDDLFKDYAEANSPIVRSGAIDWYVGVVRSRLHNNSQQLMVFTRWHEDDPIGHIEKKEKVIILERKEQLNNINKNFWYKINFPALSTRESIENEFDYRTEIDLPLWPERHSQQKLFEDRELDPEKFQSLHQGDPMPRVGLLYTGFNLYTKIPTQKYRKNFTDTADRGTDYLCSINYIVGIDDYIYIIDILYTQEPPEITEQLVADFLLRGDIKEADIESNAGGAAFARNVDRLTDYKLYINSFYESLNKESKILSNSAEAQRKILFPLNWITKWPAFSKDLLRFKKNFKANRHDDAPDALTGVLLKSGTSNNVSDALYDL